MGPGPGHLGKFFSARRRRRRPWRGGFTNNQQFPKISQQNISFFKKVCFFVGGSRQQAGPGSRARAPGMVAPLFRHVCFILGMYVSF